MALIIGRLPEDLEMFLNMTDTLYLLRMNADGTDVEIEEHIIVSYPDFDRLFQQLRHAERPIKAGDIRSWGFGKLMDETLYQYDMGSNSTLKKMSDDEVIPLAVQYDLNVNTLKSRVLAKRMELTLEKAGEERVADYSLRKEHIERAQTEARKGLKEYAESTAEAWRILQDYLKGIEGRDCSPAKTGNIRRDRSMNNLADYCSTSYTYYVFEKPFMKLVYRLGNRFRVDPILTVYDIPCWEFDFMNGGLSTRRNNQLLSDRKSFGDWMQDVFKEPDNATEHRQQIKEQIEKTLGISIANEDIFYDPASECYLLNEDAECRMLGKLIPQKAGNIIEIAKYTKFDTLVAILKSGKMRMNSIVSMNDKTETDFLDEVLRSYKEEYEQDYDKYLFADKEFITSFTTRIDDLDMWRFYGDNGRGVCMVFERDTNKDDGLYKINYIDPAKEELTKVSDMMDTLKEKGIRFRLNLLQKYCHFLKHADYDTEEEYRLLVRSDKPDGWFVNSDNGILTPYLEFELRKTGKPGDGDYPFKLKKVIVGPAMREMVANLMQVFYMGHQYGYSLEVAESKIQSYR